MEYDVRQTSNEVTALRFSPEPEDLVTWDEDLVMIDDSCHGVKFDKADIPALIQALQLGVEKDWRFGEATITIN